MIFLIYWLPRLCVTFPTWRRLLCGLRSSGELNYRITCKAKQTYAHVLLWTIFNRHTVLTLWTGKGDCCDWELLRRPVWRDTVRNSLTQIGSDPHGVSLRVQAAVMEEEASFWMCCTLSWDWIQFSLQRRQEQLCAFWLEADCASCCHVCVELLGRIW